MKAKEYVNWTGNNHREMYNFLTGDVDGYIKPTGEHFFINHNMVQSGLVIKTHNGDQIVNVGDAVIKLENGQFVPIAYVDLIYWEGISKYENRN